MTVFLCEDSLDGILTGVYDAWDSRLGHGNVRLEIAREGTPELFCEYRPTAADPDRAKKVFRTVERRLGEEALGWICGAAASADDRKADAIYRMIVLGLSLERGSEVVNCLTCEPVMLVMKLNRRVYRETDKLKGFVRFKELYNGVLYAAIRPESDVLPWLAPFFADRLSGEDWIIHDLGRRTAALHGRGKGWFLLEAEGFSGERLDCLSREEEEMEELWRCFHESIAIEERRNQKLQKGMLPLRYRPYMTEFAEKRARVASAPHI